MIKSFPFLRLSKDEPLRPWLPVKIVNPHTGKSHRTFGLIDTGADKCVIPAEYARILGHDLKNVESESTRTAGGPSKCYPHTTIIEIYDLDDTVVHMIEKTLVDCMPDLHIVLLGVRDFLDQFILHIDYPKFEFSIQYP